MSHKTITRAELSEAVYQRIGLSRTDSAELVELVWVPIDEAAHLDLPNVTEVMLKELQDRIAAGFTHKLPVPFYRYRHGRFSRLVL